MSDLISRSALIEALEEAKSEVYSPADILWNNSVKICVDIANEQPTVEAKPVVHGEWKMKVRSNGGYVASITCSACGYAHSRVTYNFCPECGADMRGKKND